MVTAITQGVKITVDTFFQEGHSDPVNDHFMFAYRISIENLTDFSIQLISRKWRIFDSNGSYRVVEGEGVVGVQPVIEPGDNYQYVSACNLKTDVGSMEGHYDMIRLSDLFSFQVAIPKFELVAPFKLN